MEQITKEDLAKGRTYSVIMNNGDKAIISQGAIILPGRKKPSTSKLSLHECRVGKPLAFIDHEYSNGRQVSTLSQVAEIICS
jgi:hypothetical protein